MLPLFDTVPNAFVVKMPFRPPEIDPPELLVTLPPPASSTPVPAVPLAVMLPLFVTAPEVPVSA